MPFTPATTTSVLAFAAIVAGVLMAFIAGVGRAFPDNSATARAITAGTAVYLGAVSLAVGTGFLESLPMSGLPFLFGIVIGVSLAAGLSPLGARMAARLPIAALVAFQGFRLPLELVLHAWVEQGTIPETMTWSGQNWDIVSGIVALVAAPFTRRRRAAAWTANVVGGVLLLNVLRVALLSAPLPFGSGVTPPLAVAWHLPYALIGPVCVGGALVGHILLTRALVARR
jgi:hypothetical protein